MRQLTLDGPRTPLGPVRKPRIAQWMAEQRAVQERMERVAAYLATPEGQAAVDAAVEELRACPECHPLPKQEAW